MSAEIRSVKDIKDHRYVDDGVDPRPGEDVDDVQGHVRELPAAAGEPQPTEPDALGGRGFLRR